MIAVDGRDLHAACRCSWPAACSIGWRAITIVGAGAFFSACGVYFVRFIRLGIIAAVVYWVLFVPYHAWLFDGLYPALIADITVERTAFFIRLALYAVFARAAASRSTSSSTTRRFARSSRIAAA